MMHLRLPVPIYDFWSYSSPQASQGKWYRTSSLTLLNTFVENPNVHVVFSHSALPVCAYFSSNANRRLFFSTVLVAVLSASLAAPSNSCVQYPAGNSLFISKSDLTYFGQLYVSSQDCDIPFTVYGSIGFATIVLTLELRMSVQIKKGRLLFLSSPSALISCRCIWLRSFESQKTFRTLE